MFFHRPQVRFGEQAGRDKNTTKKHKICQVLGDNPRAVE
jgi:hypothetical protein